MIIPYALCRKQCDKSGFSALIIEVVDPLLLAKA